MRRHPLRHARRAYLLPALLLASLAAACIAGSARPPAAAAAVTGLVGAYSFDAGSGTSLADSSGAANTGTISGPTWTTAGKTGNALSFDGVNDWVTIADKASLDLTSGMTLEAWVKPQGGGLAHSRVQGAHRAASPTGSTRAPTPAVRRPRSEPPRATSTAVPPQLASGTWSHLATTYDGSTLRLYVNGAQVASQAATGAITGTSGPLRIGGNAIWPEWFSGQIDDLRIYNRALTRQPSSRPT